MACIIDGIDVSLVDSEELLEQLVSQDGRVWQQD